MYRLLFPETEAVMTDRMSICFMYVNLKYFNGFMDVLIFLHFINVFKIYIFSFRSLTWQFISFMLMMFLLKVIISLLLIFYSLKH